MVLKVQQILSNYNHEYLNTTYGITSNFHPVDGRVILNYDQLSSKKTELVVQECRGLVLDDKYEVVAKGFNRFFNLGEHEESQKDFVWENCTCQEKVDGSLIFVYAYKGQVCINTRNSFGDGKINDSDWTWRDLVLSVLPNQVIEFVLANEQYATTLVFELCSPYNKVVRTYTKTQLFLLTVFDWIYERSPEMTLVLAEYLRLNTPSVFNVKSKDDVLALIHELEKHDPTNEGFVLRDKNNLRIKIKTKTWYALSALKDNGNLFSHRKLLPLILKNEHEEALCYFPEVRYKVDSLIEFVEEAEDMIEKVWEQVKNIGPQKEFAMVVLLYWFSPILFRARKEGMEPKDLLSEFVELFIKVYEGVK